MPEVTPWFATELYPDDNDESIGIAGNFKVLTLDQIEAWLRPLLIVDGLDERRELEKLCFADDDYWASRTAGGFVDWYARHLLARVQEWKGNTNP